MDKEKLYAEMTQRGVSHHDMCVSLDMSRSAFYRKCNGKSEFTHSEIQKIVDVLGLESPMGNFFAQKVS